MTNEEEEEAEEDDDDCLLGKDLLPRGEEEKKPCLLARSGERRRREGGEIYVLVVAFLASCQHGKRGEKVCTSTSPSEIIKHFWATYQPQFLRIKSHFPKHEIESPFRALD